MPSFGPDSLILRLISNKNMMAAVIGDFSYWVEHDVH